MRAGGCKISAKSVAPRRPAPGIVGRGEGVALETEVDGLYMFTLLDLEEACCRCCYRCRCCREVAVYGRLSVLGWHAYHVV